MIAQARAVGEGPELFLEGNQKGIKRHDFEIGGGRALESRREE